MKTKVRKTYNYLIRFVIIFATYGFIYLQVFQKRDLRSVFDHFLDGFNRSGFIYTIILLFLLMLLNWGTEALKWQLLIRKIERISWLKSLKATLTGVAVSSFTPNRIGDYFGRVFILEKANRIEGVFITILGSMSQLLVTFVLGTSGIFIMFFTYHHTLLDYFNIPLHLYKYMLWGGAILVLGLNTLFILLFLNVSLLSAFSRRFKGKTMERITTYIQVLSAFRTSELIGIIFLSLFRFLVFSGQMYILLQLFSVKLPIIPAMVIIAVIFFVMTMIPTIAITVL